MELQQHTYYITFSASLSSTVTRRHSSSLSKKSVSLGYPCESTSQCRTSDPRSVCGGGGVCVCKSAKDPLYEEVRNINGLPGKGRRKRRRRRKVIKALYGDGQARTYMERISMSSMGRILTLNS